MNHDNFRQDDNQSFNHTLFAFTSAITIILFYLVGGGVLTVSFDGLNNIEMMRLSQILGQLLFMLVPTLLMMKLSPLSRHCLLRLDNQNVRTKHILFIVLGVIFVQLFSSGWSAVQNAILPHEVLEFIRTESDEYRKLVEQILGPGGDFAFARAVLIGAVVPAICEEVLFRGLMQRSLEQKQGTAVAITNTSIFFAVGHLNPEQIVPLILIGVFLGMLANATRSLVPAILMHFINNLLAVIVLFIPNLKAIDESSNSIDVSLSVALAVVGFAGCFVLMHRLNSEQKKSAVQ